MIYSQPFQYWEYLCLEHKDTKILENYLNPVKLEFIGKLSLSSLRRVPICQGFSYFSGFCIILYYQN